MEGLACGEEKRAKAGCGYLLPGQASKWIKEHVPWDGFVIEYRQELVL